MNWKVLTHPTPNQHMQWVQTQLYCLYCQVSVTSASYTVYDACCDSRVLDDLSKLCLICIIYQQAQCGQKYCMRVWVDKGTLRMSNSHAEWCHCNGFPGTAYVVISNDIQLCTQGIWSDQHSQSAFIIAVLSKIRVDTITLFTVKYFENGVFEGFTWFTIFYMPWSWPRHV